MSISDKRPPDHLAAEKASTWVSRFAPLIPAGEVLDLACGAGRHSRLLAKLNYPVLAVDRNAESLMLAAGEGITTQQVDLENGDEKSRWPFARDRFSGIVVTNYLFRPLLDLIVGSLASDGVLIYETFAQGNEQFGKPSNPDFLLKNGELLGLATTHGLRVIAYEDGYAEMPKPAMMQRICLIKSSKPLTAEDSRLS